MPGPDGSILDAKATGPAADAIANDDGTWSEAGIGSDGAIGDEDSASADAPPESGAYLHLMAYSLGGGRRETLSIRPGPMTAR